MVNLSIEEHRNKKTALVLSGGVTKAAAWHLGVGMALEDLGWTITSQKNPVGTSDFEISTIVGSSAGALIGTYFAMGYGPHQVTNSFVGNENITLRPVGYRDMLSRKKSPLENDYFEKYNFFESFPFFLQKLLSPISKFTGFFTTLGLAEYLEKEVIKSSSFDDLNSDLFIVATQLDHSRKVIFGKYNYPNPQHDPTACYYTGTSIIDAAAASMSVPPFYSPYPVQNTYNDQVEYYIDGEIRETLSTHVAIDNGCDLVISSWTHTPYHYQKEIGSLIHYGLPGICLQAIYLMIQKKIMTDRNRKMMAKDVVATVSQYMKEQKFSEKQRIDICSIIETKLDFSSHIKLIDIYPKHTNFDLFFKNSFSLNPDVLSQIIKLGYHRTIEVFKDHDII